MRAMLVMFLAGAVAPVAAVEIDGRLEPGEWAEAQRIDDFRLTQPLSRAPAPYQTEAWILSTAEGLAIAFRNAQPAGVTRTPVSYTHLDVYKRQVHHRAGRG